MLNLGDFIRYIRMRHNLTQLEFGELFYRSKDYVYLLENNKTVPKIEELKLISKRLNEPIVMLVMYGLSIQEVIKE